MIHKTIESEILLHINALLAAEDRMLSDDEADALIDDFESASLEIAYRERNGEPAPIAILETRARLRAELLDTLASARAENARLTAELADYALLKQAVNRSADCGQTCTPDGCAEDCPRLNTARWLTDQQREIARLTAALDRVRDDTARTNDLMHDDIAEALRALGLSDVARSDSPHDVMQQLVLPAIRCLIDIDGIIDAARTQPEGSNE